MRKYFLLIALLSFIFLWLGNYSRGQGSFFTPSSSSDPTAPTVQTTTMSPDQTTWQPITTPDPYLWSSCPAWQKKIDWVCHLCSEKWVCCWVSLNTSVPFIGNCIEDSTASVWAWETNVTWESAFPVLMWSLTKILVTVILILSFVLIVVWGIMIATGNPSGGKSMIIKVVVGIALLWASWVILRLINPNFFG